MNDNNNDNTKKQGQINIELDEAVEDRFTKGDKNTTLLSINSGTIEMKDNKVIVLAD